MIRDLQKLDLIKLRWNFPHSIIDKVYINFNESFDDTDNFLDILDAHSNPKNKWKVRLYNAWEAYCMMNYIEHEIDNNPFI